ncbi:hypothetical protein [Micromonospora psammae]|uniref:hypothetical protein n=1 Tax=Micromonospora sp. CPCC 205556 TaxID=3122398 RepID=UPI002FEE6C41
MSPSSIAGVRRKLFAFAALTVVALLLGLPAPTVAALALVSLAIPVAVVVGGGRLRQLLLPGPARTPGVTWTTARNKGNAL